MKKYLLIVMLLGLSTPSWGGEDLPSRKATAATYEHLAKVIIELREAETSLVEAILLDYHQMATHYMDMAAKGMNVGPNLEMAAGEITSLANEGDKPIQAIRQRLEAAGHHHHHHSDAETQEDYIFIDAAEKKGLLDLAGKVARLGGEADEGSIRPLLAELETTFDAAMAEEK